MFSRLAFYPSEVPAIESTSKDGLVAAHKEPRSNFPISVIICARNEAINLATYLPLILAQKYPVFEVIVVDDASDDGTSEVLNDFARQNKSLRVVRLLEKLGGGKKNALGRGIAAAKYDWVLLTDADCCPASDQWIANMVFGAIGRKEDSQHRNIEIVLGFAPDYKRRGLLNLFIRYDTIWTAVQYFSFALVGEPYMGVGRNLLYKKELYYRVGGFKKHEHISSGDDDLFINEVATKKNTALVLDAQSFMYSAPKETLGSYWRQKQRRLSTGTKYRFKTQILLGALAISHFFFYLLGFFMLTLKVSTIFVCTLYVVRITLALLLYAFILKKFRHADLIFWIPLLDVAYVFYYLLFTPALMNTTQKWK